VRAIAGLRGWLARAAAWLSAEDEAARSDLPPGPAAVGRRLVAVVRAYPIASDVALAGAILSLSLAVGLHHGARPLGPVAWALQVALVAPLVWRRRSPALVFTAICVVGLVQWLYADRFAADMAILVSLYTVSRRRPRRMALAAAAAVEVGVVLAAVQQVLGVDWAPSLVLLSGMVAAAFFLGRNLRTRQAYLAALVERAERLEHERDQQARIAAAAERASIAREMHDIVAHSLAVIVTMAEAAGAKRRSDPDRAAETMQQVSEIGRQALSETRRLVGVLRTEDPGERYAPQPDLRQLDALVSQVRATGLRAELSSSGQRFPVPEGAEVAVYRIVQEALTNALKHASGATRVRVRLRYAAPVIEVEVSDDGSPVAGNGRRGRVGHGLVGMHERAALYNGSVTAGPCPGGGWAVRARVRP
jgi:signal transduction histidine kinase